MYGKLYESLYQGSMIGSGAHVFAVWGYVIAKTMRSVVELNPKLLSAILGEPPERIIDAIEYLCAPDPDSRSKAEGGRRLLKQGQYLYFVVNWAEYQSFRDANDLKEYNRRKQAEYRARKPTKKKGTQHSDDGQKANGNTGRELARTDDEGNLRKSAEPMAGHEDQASVPKSDGLDGRISHQTVEQNGGNKVEMGAVGVGVTCARCNEVGHAANDCHHDGHFEDGKWVIEK